MSDQPTAVSDAPFPTRRSLRHAQQRPEAAPSQARNSARFTAVDGFRGLAILSVLFYHSGVTSHGLFGVDVFFVVSGFFVTLLALRELRRTGRLRLGAFFGRRARRILPGVVLALIVTVALVARFGTDAELGRARRTAIAGMLQVANWEQLAANQSYWDSLGAINPLGQMWSLSITEQFYLVWPVVLLILWLLFRRHSAWLITTLILLTAVAGAVAPRSSTARTAIGCISAPTAARSPSSRAPRRLRSSKPGRRAGSSRWHGVLGSGSPSRRSDCSRCSSARVSRSRATTTLGSTAAVSPGSRSSPPC